MFINFLRGFTIKKFNIKSTTIKLLKSLYPGSTVMEFHDFFHQHMIRQYQIEKLEDSKDFLQINSTMKEEAIKYVEMRENLILDYFDQFKFDNIIIERLPLTRVVYCNIIWGIDLIESLLKFEKELFERNAIFLFLTCNDEVLIERFEEENMKNIFRRQDSTPFHIIKKNEILKKKQLYMDYFNKLQLINKFVVDTSEIDNNSQINNLKSILC